MLLRFGETEETEGAFERRSDDLCKEYIVTWRGETEETEGDFEWCDDDLCKEYIVTWWEVGWTALKTSLSDQLTARLGATGLTGIA